jgi:ethanolamine utilization protein EutN
MILGRVCGTVVCTRKDESLVGMKLLIVEELSLQEQKPTNKFVIAVDAVGAGASEKVLVVSGSSARLTEATMKKPVDAAVCAIVDSVVFDADRNQ